MQTYAYGRAHAHANIELDFFLESLNFLLHLGNYYNNY